MNNEQQHDVRALEQLSAAMDGECESQEALLRACSAWRDDERGARRAWHAWHLIGDVLRSDELAVPRPRDAHFLQVFSARLAQEPALLAPEAQKAPVAAPSQRFNAGNRGRWWSATAAVAAGFAVVAGALFVLQTPPASSPGGSLVQTEPAGGASVAVATMVTPLGALASSRAAVEAEEVGPILRNPRLQQYLAAHKQFGGSTALGAPSAFLRSATVDVTPR